MGYWQRWEGSADPADESGTAHFVVDGVKYSPRLPKFTDCSVIEKLLNAAFNHGARSAADSIEGEVHQAAERARNGRAP